MSKLALENIMNDNLSVMEKIKFRPYYYLDYGVDLCLLPSTRERALRKMRLYRRESYLAWKAWVNIERICPFEDIDEEERRWKIEEYKKAFYQAAHLVGVIEESSWKGGWRIEENRYGGYSPYRCTPIYE